mgnify:CR=1 FL=1
MKKPLAVAALVVAGALAPAGADEPAPTNPPKNLQVLPKDTPRADVTALMKQFNKALGVKCAFCHDTKDYASDENKHKKQARQMMRMTQDMHEKYFSGEKDPNMKFNCYVCHRGHDEPELKPQ